MNLVTIALLALSAQVQAGSTGGVEVQVALDPDSARVGEPLALTVSVRGLPANALVYFPEIPDSTDLAALGPPQPVEGEAGVRVARYALVAWATGEVELPRGTIRVETDGTEMTIPLPELVVRVASVLPADADVDTLAWQPPADVVGGNWSLGEKLAASGLLIAVLVSAFLYLRRRGRSTPVPVPAPPSARERALTALDALARCGLAEAGELKGFYSALSQVLRQFLADTEALWGLDLTTLQLVVEVARDGIEGSDVQVLEALLTQADLVKFARLRPTSAEAAMALTTARAWVAGFVRTMPEPELEEPDTFEAAEGEAADVLTELEDIFAGGSSEPEVPADKEVEGA